MLCYPFRLYNILYNINREDVYKLLPLIGPVNAYVTILSYNSEVVFNCIECYVMSVRDQTCERTVKEPHTVIAQSLPCSSAMLGPVLLLRHDAVARILANGIAAFFESCDAIGWKACDVSQKR